MSPKIRIWRPFLWLWASPATLIGMSIGVLGLLTGGTVERHGRTLEFSGGCIRWMLARTPIGAVAMTLGHVVIGRDVQSLTRCRDHEWVHVRQYERWGPLFLPAYLGCSLYLWLLGYDPYRENPFEVEAYDEDRRRAAETGGKSPSPPADDLGAEGEGD